MSFSINSFIDVVSFIKDILVYNGSSNYEECTVEKQNILKGKWQITSIKDEIWGVCSNCGFKQKAGELNFCPNCGVNMRGNDETNKN